MLGFTLLKDSTFYKENKSTPDGAYVNGRWVEGETIYTYDPIEGIREPYSKAESSSSLPEGVKSSESFKLYTESELYTHNDLEGTARVADIIYFQNPEIVSTAHPFVVWDKEAWDANDGFELLTGDYGYYILIRQDKLPS